MAAKDTREASSLWEGAGTITNVQFTKEAPDNYEAQGNPIFGVVSILADGDGDEDSRKQQQSYSLGAKAGEEFTISPDGYGLIPVDAALASSIRKGSKWDMFKCSLENEGVSSAIFAEGDMSKIIGVHAQFKRMNDPERSFNDNNPKRKESKFKPQTLLCVKLLDAVKTTASTGAATTTAAPAGNVPDGDLDTVATEYLQQALATAKDGKIQRAQVTLAVNRLVGTKDARRLDIAKRVADEAFLAELTGLGIVKYDPAAKPQVIERVAVN